MKTETYTTTTGITVEILPMPHLLAEQVRAQAEQDALTRYGEPVRPTYAMTTAGGAVEIQPHDENTLETAQDKAAWAAYTEKKDRIDRHVNRVMIDFVLANCVRADLPADETWLEQMEASGLRIPQSKTAQRVLYLKNVIINPEDLNAINRKAMELTGVRQEVIDAAQSNFPRPARGRAAGAGAGENQPQAG